VLLLLLLSGVASSCASSSDDPCTATAEWSHGIGYAAFSQTHGEVWVGSVASNGQHMGVLGDLARCALAAPVPVFVQSEVAHDLYLMLPHSRVLPEDGLPLDVALHSIRMAAPSAFDVVWGKHAIFLVRP